LWLDDGRAVGDVSSSTDFYNVIQYGDILEALGRAVEQYDGQLGLSGEAAISPSGHKFSAQLDFQGDTDVLLDDGEDVIQLGVKARSGHSGFHAVKYDVGAERQVCSNGMMAFVSNLHFEQTHQEPLDYGLAQHAVDAVVEGSDAVEDRLEQAQEREFYNMDEALLVLHDLGLDRYFEEPNQTLAQCLCEEMEDDGPTLYETYNAATRALTHYVGDDVPQYQVDEGLEQSAYLLDGDGYGLPEIEYLAGKAVTARADAYLDSDEPESVDQYWEGERDAVETLMEEREYELASRRTG
jgi:hypothetical protein